MPNILSFDLDDPDIAPLLGNALVEYAIALDTEAHERALEGRESVAAELRRVAERARGYAAVCKEASQT